MEAEQWPDLLPGAAGTGVMIIQGFLICGELSCHFQASFFVFSLRHLLHILYNLYSSPPAMDCLFFFFFNIFVWFFFFFSTDINFFLILFYF